MGANHHVSDSLQRHRDILRKKDQGKSNVQIAAEMEINESTVRYYLRKPAPQLEFVPQLNPPVTASDGVKYDFQLMAEQYLLKSMDEARRHIDSMPLKDLILGEKTSLKGIMGDVTVHYDLDAGLFRFGFNAVAKIEK